MRGHDGGCPHVDTSLFPSHREVTGRWRQTLRGISCGVVPWGRVGNDREDQGAGTASSSIHCTACSFALPLVSCGFMTSGSSGGLEKGSTRRGSKESPAKQEYECCGGTGAGPSHSSPYSPAQRNASPTVAGAWGRAVWLVKPQSPKVLLSSSNWSSWKREGDSEACGGRGTTRQGGAGNSPCTVAGPPGVSSESPPQSSSAHTRLCSPWRP